MPEQAVISHKRGVMPVTVYYTYFVHVVLARCAEFVSSSAFGPDVMICAFALFMALAVYDHLFRRHARPYIRNWEEGQ